MMFLHDHESLEEFVRALARATTYKSWDTGDVITEYWKDEAQEWVKELDARSETVRFRDVSGQGSQVLTPTDRLTPTHSVSATREALNHKHKDCRRRAFRLVESAAYKLYQLKVLGLDKCSKARVNDEVIRLIEKAEGVFAEVRDALRSEVSRDAYKSLPLSFRYHQSQHDIKTIRQETIARKLSGYDDATWSKLREDRKRTYRRAADSLITQWPEFAKLFEVKS